LVFLVALCCLWGTKYLFQKRLQELDALRGPDTEELRVSYRGDALKQLTFGFESFFASLIWVQLLQEAKVTPLKANFVSWEYSEVDSVTTLDPNFEPAYNFGALFVSFLRRDKIGGKQILEKWVEHSPIYWKPHHMLGMHYFLELEDYANAAPHLIRASQLAGAPPYIASLGVGLLSQSGANLYALQSACELFETATHAEVKIRLAKRILGLRWHLEKQSWEQALSEFRKKQKGALPQSIDELSAFMKSHPSRELASLAPNLAQSAPLKRLFAEKFRFILGKDRKSIESADPEKTKEIERIGVYIQKDSP